VEKLHEADASRGGWVYNHRYGKPKWKSVLKNDVPAQISQRRAREEEGESSQQDARAEILFHGLIVSPRIHPLCSTSIGSA
jgi:hypothetical protein